MKRELTMENVIGETQGTELERVVKQNRQPRQDSIWLWPGLRNGKATRKLPKY